MTARPPAGYGYVPAASLPSVAPRPTLRDVATQAGVHPATASRALNEATRSLVRPATVARVREVAAALGYQVNPIARSLKTSRSETVGVLVPDLTNPLFPPIVRGIEDALADNGYTVLTANTDNDPARTSSNFAAMQARQVDGFIVATALLDDPLMHEAAARGVPMVLVNRLTEHLDVSAVSADDATGIERTVDHLVELGHRDIAHVAGPLQVSTGAVRLRAFRAAMQRHGLRDDRIVATDTYSEPAGRTALLQLLEGDDRPTGVVAGNDLLALGCYDALEELGLSCPRDLSIVGFNDMPFISRLQPPLTSVRVPQYELGVEAARLLLDRLSGRTVTPRVVLLPVQLVVRGSTAPPPS
jgi:LacI family transcriptional regulator, galactose operon repressor